MKFLGLGPESRGAASVDHTFEALALPHIDSLYNFACWLVRDRAEAEDAVQETCLKALRSFRRFEPGTNFRAWIFQILKNTISSERTRHGRQLTQTIETEDDFPVHAASLTTPETLLIARTSIEAVRAAIEQLPPVYREVILLCNIQEASYREIAEVLSIPIGTVMSRLARARKLIRLSLLGNPPVAQEQKRDRVAPVPRNTFSTART
jgi:RNA polymerase sigma factor (sigma-70 family)